jgi:hypothetical protein
MKERRFLGILSVLFLFVFLTICFSGCAATRHTVAKNVIPLTNTTVDDMVYNLMKTKNADFIEDGLPGALLVITGLVEMAPTDYKLLSTACFLYAAYGLFVEDENPEYAISLFKTGTDYGMRALKANNSKFRKAIEKRTRVADAVKFTTKDDLKALTWYGINLAKRITLQLENMDEFMDLPDAVAAGKRALELDPNYDWGANWNVLGIYYAIMPAYGGLGGGAQASREAFANGNKVENGEFGWLDLFMARYLCPVIKDRDLFDKLLNRVIEMDSCKISDGLCMINELGKKKARFMLKNKDKYFGD